MPTVSFCATNYNKGDVIRESVESILRVLPEQGELIIVDGGSSDESIQELQRIEDTRLKVSITPCNAGEGRQKAFEMASGDIVVQQCDTDILYRPEASKYLDAFRYLESEHEDLVLATFDTLFICRRETMEKIGRWPPLSRQEERVFSDRVLDNATLRILPVRLSKELPTRDVSTPLLRAKKWRRSCRDKVRAGFAFRHLVKFNHNSFSLPRALAADTLATLGWIDAKRMMPPRYGRERVSWHEIPTWRHALLVENGITGDNFVYPEDIDMPLEAKSLVPPDKPINSREESKLLADTDTPSGVPVEST